MILLSEIRKVGNAGVDASECGAVEDAKAPVNHEVREGVEALTAPTNSDAEDIT